MQNELKRNMTSLQSKIEKLIFLHNKVLEDNLKLQALVESLHQQIASQNTLIEELEKEKVELLNNRQPIENSNLERHKMRNEQINEMMRDIDKCIALLSMNKKNV
jgi:formate dehydrogenase maturation protein FdhE